MELFIVSLRVLCGVFVFLDRDDALVLLGKSVLNGVPPRLLLWQVWQVLKKPNERPQLYPVVPSSHFDSTAFVLAKNCPHLLCVQSFVSSGHFGSCPSDTLLTELWHCRSRCLFDSHNKTYMCCVLCYYPGNYSQSGMYSINTSMHPFSMQIHQKHSLQVNVTLVHHLQS